MGAVAIFNFKNDLVLVVWFLDEIYIILRIGIAHQTLNRRRGNAIRRGASSIDVDPEVGSVVIVIGADTGKAFELLKLLHQLVCHRVDILGHDTADGVGILALRLARSANADLQHWTRS